MAVQVRVAWPNQREMSGFCPVTGCKAIIDTGTYLIYGPQQTVQRILSGSLGSPCGSSLEELPVIHFDFAGTGRDAGRIVTLTLRPKDYILSVRSWKSYLLECAELILSFLVRSWWEVWVCGWNQSGQRYNVDIWTSVFAFILYSVWQRPGCCWLR